MAVGDVAVEATADDVAGDATTGIGTPGRRSVRDRSGPRGDSLGRRLLDGADPVVLLFPGLDPGWPAAIHDQLVGRGAQRSWVAEVLDHLRPTSGDRSLPSPRDVLAAAVEGHDLDPAVAALSPWCVPGTVLSQLLAVRLLAEDGLDGLVRPTTHLCGHSAGQFAAGATAAVGVDLAPSDAAAVLELATATGMASQHHPWAVGTEELDRALNGDDHVATPMALVRGPRRGQVDAALERFGARSVEVGLTNGPTTHVLVGPPAELTDLRRRTEALAAELADRRRAGRPVGTAAAWRWEPLPISSPFHHTALTGAASDLVAGWSADPVVNRVLGPPRHATLIDPADGATVIGPFLEGLIRSSLERAVGWELTIRSLSGAGTTFVDVGPGRAMTSSTVESADGTGSLVVNADGADGRRTLLTPGVAAEPTPDHGRFAPTVVDVDGLGLRIENRHTRLTGRSPIVLAGMTPTTTDAAIVAAAANGGHVAELAGGGQVTEEILATRLAELADRLAPGQEVVFNALVLDPYLWDLHLGRRRLVQRARAAGAPVCGVTVSAGIPPVDEAVALLDELHDLGVWCNAFKPGTIDQVDQVLDISARTPHTFWLHLEGGQAGGHHSWEDLDDLLLATYARIRRHPNVVLAAGGGVGDPDRAAALLTGDWSVPHDGRARPVDAVLVGTAAMAAAESTATPSVKQALAATRGAGGWVARGEVSGGMTSGRSGLEADIHFVDNAASRAARLLDEVAGDAEAVAARRDEIVEALARTAKPFFGDLSAMTYEEVLRRFAELVAVGLGGPYEDGRWLDRSHREIFRDLVQRTEGRLDPVDEGMVPTDVADPTAVDDPEAAVATLLARHPVASTARLHPADVDWFVSRCRAPGKPVPFVPVIDGDVRRWYQSDALWQAHHPHYDADQVLIIPGPVGVAGIAEADEPVAELLDRFEAGVVDRLVARNGFEPERLPARRFGQADGSDTHPDLPAPVRAAVAAPTWRWAGHHRPNPLRALGEPVGPGRWRSGAEELVLQSSPDGGVDMVVTWPGRRERAELRIALRVTARNGHPVVEVPAETLGRAATTVLPGSVPAGPSVAASHALLVGGGAPLPDRWMRAAWPAIGRALAQADIAPGVFDLLHATHRVELAGPDTGDAPDDTAPPEVHLEVGSGAHPAGTLVTTVCRIGAGNRPVATVTDGFVIRGARGDADGSVPATREPADEGTVPTPRRLLGARTVRAPERLEEFAAVTGDPNPIHLSDLVARLCGLPGRIVHGMWTSAVAQRITVDVATDGRADRLRDWSIHFDDVVLPGDELDVRVERTGARAGSRVLQVTVTGPRGPVARATAVVAAVRTAYVFPGQGVQAPGMGMDGFARSAAARAVWERADAHCRSALGFSVLEVVRANPVQLDVRGTTYRHPAGVLFLTQFTQVAMATLACAQVAEFDEAGVLDPDAVCAGHSVGEYNALAALGGVLELENLVSLVFARGSAMHHLVPRDAHGCSDHRLGVVRPHLAGLDHAGVEALVADVARDVGLCEVVNHNLRGKQYAVAGTIDALAELERRLGPAPARGREPFLLVPGIDVPFHSSALRGGVDEFRTHLEANLPDDLDPGRLEGRYVPNLYPEPFRIDRDYVAAVSDLLGGASAALVELLARWDDPGIDGEARTRAGRILLIELLAWQFASPVRWIETTDVLCRDRNDGGLGVERIVEVGVGTQPTLANLTRGALALPDHCGGRPAVVHAEVDLDVVLERDADPVAAASDDVATDDPQDASPAPVDAGATPAPASTRAPADVPDRPITAADAVVALVALRTQVAPEQIGDDSLEDLVDGASSRRNQVLMDLGREFGLPAQDGAHERALPELAELVDGSCPTYRFPGPVLAAAVDAGVTGALGPLGAAPSLVTDRLRARGLGPGWVDRVRLHLTLASRTGPSRRGGDLRQLPDDGPAADVVDAALARVADELGVELREREAPAAAADPAAVAELGRHIEGLLGDTARHLLDALGGDDGPEPATGPSPAIERLTLLDREHGAGRAEAVRPLFDPRRHVFLGSGSMWARADLDRLYHLSRGAGTGAEADELVDRIVAWRDADARIAATARWYRDRAASHRDDTTVARLDRVLGDPARGATVDGDLVDVRDALAPADRPIVELAQALAASPGTLRHEVVLVTGASPGSIAAAALPHLLRGGATVVVTSSGLTADRIDAYRELERRWSGPGAELHLVPANLASFGDIDALVEWLVTPTDETFGPVTRRVKEALWPTVVMPFAAASVAGDVPDTGPDDEVAHRVLLTGVERLVGGLAERTAGRGTHALRVVVPLSPNLGMFGGDGAYAAAKAGLGTLVRRARSEERRWGRAVRFVAPTIGWVRGTGLMAHHDTRAPVVEERLGIRTFSSGEMGALMAAACTPAAAERAAEGPWMVDLSGGLGDHTDLATVTGPARTDAGGEDGLPGGDDHGSDEAADEGSGTVPALSSLPAALLGQTGDLPAWPATTVDVDDLVVLVGVAEMGPWGMSSTRLAAELGGPLPADAVAELAWRCGLVRWDRRNACWVDVADDAPVAEADLAARYRDRVAAACGVRAFEIDGTLDPAGIRGRHDVYLDRAVTVQVSSEEDARALVAADPDHHRAGPDPDGEGWTVTLRPGARISLPRLRPLERRVGGQFPTGSDPVRHGVPAEAATSTDRLAQWNMVVTAAALADAGTEAEELLDAVHPSLVGNTQGTGMGGTTSLTEVYTRADRGAARTNDVLQEALGNVVAGHVNQSVVGGYGPMVHPVAACATAAVSLEEAVDKIRLGKADVVVAGGWDDLGTEGVLGFGDMAATAPTDLMEARGLDPRRHSRPGDRRRAGFVESQGGGTFVVTRGSVALELGLPVRAVVGYAASFGDGIHTSIPAPGLGALGCVRGGPSSPLGVALRRLGLGPDDIEVVSKHDTSTAANDPNEAEIHELVQQALGRSPGAPLRVVSQKSVLGHAKGGAAAWQVAGLCDVLGSGVVPGNPNLCSIDPAVVPGDHLVLDDRPLHRAEPVRAALLTSLGFGHVSAVVLLVHPSCFLAAVPPDRRPGYLAAATTRRRDGAARALAERHGGPPLLRRRSARPERDDEVALLTGGHERVRRVVADGSER